MLCNIIELVSKEKICYIQLSFKHKPMIKRRTVIRNIMVGGVGTALGSSFVPSAFTDSEIKAAPVGKPKRVIFFLQNNGFHTDTCIPLGMSGLSVPVCIGILLFARTTLAPNPLSVSNLEADNSVAAQLASF